MLYAYFGGLGGNRQATYELMLHQHELNYTLVAVMTACRATDEMRGLQALWGKLRGGPSPSSSRVLYRGGKERRALVALLEAACAANLAELGQRFCYVLPSVPAQPGALAPLIPSQLRHDNTLPFHPQLWQAGRPLDTLPLERHSQLSEDALTGRSHRGGERRHPLQLRGDR